MPIGSNKPSYFNWRKEIMRDLVPNGLFPTRDDLFYPFEQVFNKVIDEFFHDRSLLDGAKSKIGFPRLDVVTDKDQWIVEVSLPGLKEDDISVEILPYQDKKVLKISGQMNDDRQYPSEAKFHVRELRRSRFERSMVLPDNLKGDPEAVLEDGILKLTWKAEMTKLPEKKQISIRKG